MKDLLNHVGVQFALGLIAAVLAVSIYLLPAIIANHTRRKGVIGAINLLLGWTVIGWIITLVWAIKEKKAFLKEEPGKLYSLSPEQLLEPLVLSKQITGLTIVSLAFLAFGGIVGGAITVLTGIFAFCDAWTAGINKYKNSKSLINLSPMGWAIAMEGLMLVTFPCYLINRCRLKTKANNNVFFILLIALGALQFLILGVQILAKLKGLR